MRRENQKRTKVRERPLFQDAFLQWFEKNSSDFLVPVRVKRISSRCIMLKFENFPDGLSVRVHPLGLDVDVVWKRIWWDTLISLEINPKPCPGGYLCTLCGDLSALWSSVNALCVDHLYEPFLSWVNNELEPADKLLIYRFTTGGTWAFLNNAKSQPHNAENVIAEWVLPKALATDCAGL